ncbi:MAG: GNAT family N-acetyltransferase [Acidobacteria bacterium]|nr:GNAT family N-acetyltransferase [Acidobacteriota bacterium]
MHNWKATVPFTIRDYRASDFEALWKIDQACFAPGISYTRWELQTYMGRSGGFTLIAETDERGKESAQEPSQSKEERILGFLVAESTRRRRGHIITIDVRLVARRQHVGSELLELAEERFLAQACGAIQLETAVDNTGALSFYKRHGYNVIKTVPRYYANGVDALVLEKHLRSRF